MQRQPVPSVRLHSFTQYDLKKPGRGLIFFLAAVCKGPSERSHAQLDIDRGERIGCDACVPANVREIQPMNKDNAPITPVADDRPMGLAMLVVFTTAILTVTGAVAVLALVGRWWVLGLAFAVHVLMTTIVSLVVFGALRDGRLGSGGRARPSGIDDAHELELPLHEREAEARAYAAAA